MIYEFDSEENPMFELANSTLLQLEDYPLEDLFAGVVIALPELTHSQWEMRSVAVVGKDPTRSLIPVLHVEWVHRRNPIAQTVSVWECGGELYAGFLMYEQLMVVHK